MTAPARWPWPEALPEETAIPLRLAALKSGGTPLIVPLWYEWRDDAFWCVTHREARLLRRVRAHPLVGFDVSTNEPPYAGVSGDGRVTVHGAEQAAAILPRLIDRYTGSREHRLARWLLGRLDEEVALEIRPQHWRCWDFSRRMRDL
ncbi:MAG: pyridoxamine 5'-phosphate oxidase family protein [Candidatus Dadabacteria bacterium]|nr:MAG: pyridoxamine 5'-phosphate oxidase family protein [Candidatus Dadabacteria bacterium]